eukprot:6353439-Alexandrium_andersonii.AAC.1
MWLSSSGNAASWAADGPFEPLRTCGFRRRLSSESAVATIRPMWRAASRRDRESWLPSVFQALIARAASGACSGLSRSGTSCTDGAFPLCGGGAPRGRATWSSGGVGRASRR